MMPFNVSDELLEERSHLLRVRLINTRLPGIRKKGFPLVDNVKLLRHDTTSMCLQIVKRLTNHVDHLLELNERNLDEGNA